MGLPRRDQDSPDPIKNHYALWVQDAFQVTYDQVCRNSGQAVQRQKRLYDKRVVRRLFAVGDWTMRYYPPAKKCKLDSAWVGPYLIVSLAGWAVGVQLQPASQLFLVHCQDLKKILHHSGLVSWIDAARLEGLPVPPILGISTDGPLHTEVSLYDLLCPRRTGHYCPGAPLSIPAGCYWDPCYIIRWVWLWTYLPELCDSVVTFLPQEVLLVDTTISLYYIRSSCTGWMLALFALQQLLMRSIIASQFCRMM